MQNKMKGKIFNAQEVQAILNGSKVMFREVIKPQPKNTQYCGNNPLEFLINHIDSLEQRIKKLEGL